MAKQRKTQEQSYAERLERSLRRWPIDHPASSTYDAVTVGRFADASGDVWMLRHAVTKAVARRMASTADVMVVGDPGLTTIVDEPGRQATWHLVHGGEWLPPQAAGDPLDYSPYEFESEDGRVMLFVQRYR